MRQRPTPGMNLKESVMPKIHQPDTSSHAAADGRPSVTDAVPGLPALRPSAVVVHTVTEPSPAPAPGSFPVAVGVSVPSTSPALMEGASVNSSASILNGSNEHRSLPGPTPPSAEAELTSFTSESEHHH